MIYIQVFKPSCEEGGSVLAGIVVAEGFGTLCLVAALAGLSKGNLSKKPSGSGCDLAVCMYEII